MVAEKVVVVVFCFMLITVYCIGSGASAASVTVDSSSSSTVFAGNLVRIPVTVSYDEGEFASLTLSVPNQISGVTITVSNGPVSKGTFTINSAPENVTQMALWFSPGTALPLETVMFYITVSPDCGVSSLPASIPVTVNLVEFCSTDAPLPIHYVTVTNASLSASDFNPGVKVIDTLASEEWSAVTAAKVVYEFSPAQAAGVFAPQIVHEENILRMSNVSVVQQLLNGTCVAVPATVSDDGHVVLSGPVDDSVPLTVSFTGCKLGDITGDGKVNTADKIKLGQYVAEKISLESEALFYADITGDDKVNTADKIKLGQYVAEKLDPHYNLL